MLPVSAVSHKLCSQLQHEPNKRELSLLTPVQDTIFIQVVKELQSPHPFLYLLSLHWIVPW